MDASATTIDVSASGHSINAQHLAWADDRLGPAPGKWDGYDEIPDSDVRRQVWTKVGYIHGLSAEAGRNIVSIGETLQEMKEMLPHGQFMSCVEAEFKWGKTWCNQLMLIAKRFSNYQSTGNLPSSAQVLALLASHGADDATVELARKDKWSVATTKQKLRNPSGSRQPQPVEVLALSLIRKGELPRIREALALAERTQIMTAQQVMDEQRLREIGKQRFIAGIDADFHRMKDGNWVRIPHPDDSDCLVESAADAAVQMFDDKTKPSPEIDSTTAEDLFTTNNDVLLSPQLGVMSYEKAAEILGLSTNTVKCYTSPKFIAGKGHFVSKSGIKLLRATKGLVCLASPDP